MNFKEWLKLKEEAGSGGPPIKITPVVKQAAATAMQKAKIAVPPGTSAGDYFKQNPNALKAFQQQMVAAKVPGVDPNLPISMDDIAAIMGA